MQVHCLTEIAVGMIKIQSNVILFMQHLFNISLHYNNTQFIHLFNLFMTFYPMKAAKLIVTQIRSIISIWLSMYCKYQSVHMCVYICTGRTSIALHVQNLSYSKNCLQLHELTELNLKTFFHSPPDRRSNSGCKVSRFYWTTADLDSM